MERASPRGGTLYLVPNLLGAVEPERVLPARTIDVARDLTHWVVETPKAARAFLATLALQRPIAALDIRPLSTGGHDGSADTLALLRGGADVGLLSDAGCPGIADPGASLVQAAHENAIRVVPLVGPSAILLALMASGLNGQRFCFEGYVPAKTQARIDALRALEQQSRTERRTALFIETPYRNAALLRSMCETLAPRTRVCVAVDLTLDTETVECRTVAGWRGEDGRRFDRRPAIFLLQA
ncbi:MAG TPA: SAM-dependent methyltransferase [Casimicrobiaceae bacterium]|jgi:16S rRNA (cytidine1402-2'-O)-methyltransferase|nr:SAM-dependent methyltransferase [Casimicrobiaceae bacterium]